MDFVTIYIMVVDDNAKSLFEQRRFEAVGKVNVKEIQFTRKNMYLKYMYVGVEFNEVKLYNPLPYRGPYYIKNKDYNELN